MLVTGAPFSGRLSHYVAISCLAAATLGFELVQTRILSALYYNHVVYLTVTIALMGFGISGVLVSLFSKGLVNTHAAIAAACAFFAVSMIVCMHAVSHLPAWYPGKMLHNKLLYSYLLLMVPFLCSGTAIGLILMECKSGVFKLYCSDLAASALACVGFTLLLTPLGAEGFIWVCVSLALLASAAQLHAARVPFVAKPGPLLLLVLLGTGYGNSVVGTQPESYKSLYRAFTDRMSSIEATVWTPITRIDLVSNPKRRYITNEPADNGSNYKLITQDSDAFTQMPNRIMVDKVVDAARARRPDASTLSLLYLMRSHTQESLVIGVGGGMDMVRSHAYGATHTTGVDLNPETIALVRKNADYTLWPDWSGIELVIDEGRRFVRSHANTYDTITMNGIDTFSALNSGAYVLSENYLYTVEAFEDYLKALKPDGTMAIMRWLETGTPRESLRLVSLYMEAAKRMGIENPQQCIMVIEDNLVWMRWATTFIRKKPFTAEELDVVLRQLPFNYYRFAMVYLPKIFPASQQATVEAEVYSSHPYLATTRQAYSQVIAPHSLEKKASFLSRYPYDVTPVYDDRPFFFEYHKGGALTDWNKGVHTIRGADARSGLKMLLYTAAALSLVAMIGPLLVFNAQGLSTPGFIWLFLYFSSLGVGFMLVEIGMMQRLSLYLGDPMRSLSVVLSSLLVSAGIGSYISPLIQPAKKRFYFGTLGTCAMVALWLLVMPHVIQYTQNFFYSERVAIAVLGVLPAGMAMGIPFSSGLSLVGAHSARIMPWAWGINGLTSVLASILAILLAMRFGFTIVLAAGAAIYVLGFISIFFYLRTYNRS